MLTAVRATYDKGQIIWHEQPPTREKTEIVVTFLDGESETIPTRRNNVIRLGSLVGKISLGDDFNDPLEDLKDYM